jgi:hypothetical protein
MRITVTRTIDVPDDLGSVNELEQLVREEGFSLMRELMADLWQRLQDQRLDANAYRCPKCGSERVWRVGERKAELLTAFGQVELARARVRCVACGSYSQPLAEWLEELGEHRASWFVQELQALAAASWPYQAAETIVERILFGEVSHEQIRRVGTAEGERVAQVLAEEATEVLATPIIEEEADPTKALNLALDGNWVRSRDNQAGMEAKVGVVYTGVELIGRNGEGERKRLLNRRYAATFQGSEHLGKLIYAEATKLDVEKASRLRLLGDGAGWIDTIGDEHFARAKRVLDLWHLERSLSRGLKAAISDPEELRLERRKLSALVRQGKGAEVLGELRALVDAKRESGKGQGDELKVPKELLETVTYVGRHRGAIIDYEAAKAQGEHLGSGAIEKAGDLAVNRRFKGHRGMRWWRKNADGILALRVIHLNGDWDSYWQNRRSHACKAV